MTMMSEEACAPPGRASRATVSESRRIVFSNEALGEALVELERRMMLRRPVGAVVSCELATDPGLPARVTFHDALREQTEVAEVAQGKLAMALIHYCIQEGIPVPREAEKTLKLAGGKVSLNFALSRACR